MKKFKQGDKIRALMSGKIATVVAYDPKHDNLVICEMVYGGQLIHIYYQEHQIEVINQ